MDVLFTYSGFIASIWIVFGVIIAASRYPGYRHSTQFCSELGAVGSPTQSFSPMINNYPLSVLFSIFGWQVIQHSAMSPWFILVGSLIIVHGVGTGVAGYFPMDADPNTKQPSQACKIHSWAGFIMLLALYIAPLICLFLERLTIEFKVFSVTCLLLSVYFMFTMVKAYKVKTNPGTYQRLSYGFQLLWLSGLCWVLA